MKIKCLAVVVFVALISLNCTAAVVSHWKCDETGSTSDNTLPAALVDSVGGHNGSFYFEAGLLEFASSGAGLGGIDYGNALRSNNLGNKVELGYVSEFNFDRDDFTITGWFNSSNHARHGRILQHGWYGDGGYSAHINKYNGRFVWTVQSSNTEDANSNIVLYSDEAVDDGQWHWFAGMVDDETLYMYVDGVLQDDSGAVYDANTTATTPSSREAWINKDTAATVDDIAIYDTALSSTLDGDSLVAGELYNVWHGLPASGPTDCNQVWIGGYGLESDLNKDCKVDFVDISEFALEWLVCNDPCDLNCTSNW